jgi:hypothetical protein|tara:strand:- start:77 stop:271 length:195 start_codon:yes stop_codon:yes gene_type:complete
MMDITVVFTVDEKDLAEANNYASPRGYPTFDLRDIIQQSLYDNTTGPSLSGQFKIKAYTKKEQV